MKLKKITMYELDMESDDFRLLSTSAKANILQMSLRANLYDSQILIDPSAVLNEADDRIEFYISFEGMLFKVHAHAKLTRQKYELKKIDEVVYMMIQEQKTHKTERSKPVEKLENHLSGLKRPMFSILQRKDRIHKYSITWEKSPEDFMETTDYPAITYKDGIYFVKNEKGVYKFRTEFASKLNASGISYEVCTTLDGYSDKDILSYVKWWKGVSESPSLLIPLNIAYLNKLFSTETKDSWLSHISKEKKSGTKFEGLDT